VQAIGLPVMIFAPRFIHKVTEFMKKFVIIFIGLLVLAIFASVWLVFKTQSPKGNSVQLTPEQTAALEDSQQPEIYTAKNMPLTFNRGEFVVWDVDPAYEASGTEKTIFSVWKDIQLTLPQDITYYSNGSQSHITYMLIDQYDNPKRLGLDDWVKGFVAVRGSGAGFGYCPPLPEGGMPTVNKKAIPKIETVETQPYRLIGTDNACGMSDFIHFFSNADGSQIYSLELSSLKFGGNYKASDEQKYFDIFNSIHIIEK
jgi:hypothetical protein